MFSKIVEGICAVGGIPHGYMTSTFLAGYQPAEYRLALAELGSPKNLDRTIRINHALHASLKEESK